jgi:thymidylate synthase
MEIIKQLYGDITRNGIKMNTRGNWVKEMPCPMAMAFQPDEWFIHFTDLKLKWKYVKEELKWYIKGDRKDLSIQNHASIWNDCVDHLGYIQSNYGYYFNDQLSTLVEILSEDRNSRRAVLPINNRMHNYIGAPDVPCTMYISFLIRGDRLCAHVHMRSQDAVFGLRNDLPAFQMFKLRLAERLGVPPGILYILVDSLHVYKRHWDDIHKVATRPNEENYFPGFTTVKEMEKWLNESVIQIFS